MRTLVVPTDFSPTSRNAALYALNLAGSLKANIELCNAFTIPSENPMHGQISWAVYEYPELLEENNKNIQKEVKTLMQKVNKLFGDGAFPFHPSIDYVSELGETVQIISDTASDKKAILIVMGMTGAGKTERFLFGSNSIKMIEKTKHPLLLVPANYHYRPLDIIAFATDLNKKDIPIAQSLLNFAKYFKAELLITHIIQSTNDVIEDSKYEKKKETFLKKLDGEFCYNCIYSENIHFGLDLLKNKNIDLLVMGHKHREFLEGLIKSSNAVEQANDLQVPLLIIPEGQIAIF